MNDNEKKSKKSTIIATFLILVILIGAGFFLVRCIINNQNSTPGSQPLTRAATINDIYIDLSQEFSLDMNYKVIPNVDISNLKITFKFYDNNKKVLSSQEKSLGNVKKGIEYPVAVSLIGYVAFIDLFKIETCRAIVTSGNVSYFS